VKSFFGRGGTPTTKSSGVGRRRLTLVMALSISLLAGLSFSVAALAASTPGTYTLPTDTSTVQTGTTYTVTGGSDSPTTTNGWQPAPAGYSAPANDGLGVAPGSIKHVWEIVLENKAYNASFTPLEGTQGSYLNALPEQGALLTNYYGTGHSSLDNYLSMASGQAPQADDQNDCGTGYTAMAGSVDTSGSLTTNPNYGQFDSSAGADAPAGDNGCVYPSTVPTIFNQLDAASKSWKVYAQDLNTTDYPPSTSQNAGTADCGAPDAAVGPVPTSAGNAGAIGTTYGNDGSANSLDQYVSKHNPLPWFESELPSSMYLSSGGTTTTDCTSDLAPVLGAHDQLFTDLQSESTTPDFSLIVPNNCSNGHDAVCAGNNLSGGFGTGASAQVPNSPTNYTGGTYSESLFLQHVIPEIEASPAFNDNGLIIVTYDESYPPFTWQNSFVNSTLLPSTAFGSLITDQAGETLYGRSLNWEPTGPNATLVYGQNGQVLTPGPGFDENVDRPTSADGSVLPCTAGNTTSGYVTYGSSGSTFTSPTPTAPFCEKYSGVGAGTPDAVSAQAAVTVGTGSNVVADASTTQTTLKNDGMEVTCWGALVSGACPTADTPGSGLTAVTLDDNGTDDYQGAVYVGDVTNTPETATNPSGNSPKGIAFTGQFELVDASGNPVTVDTGFSGTLEMADSDVENDPFFDAFDPTTGGGDAGAILISPYIKPGTVSNTYYNHYSLLRSLEDIFQVASGSGNSAAPGYTGSVNVSTGLDGSGHIGYAAQPGLAPFGSDVFTNLFTPATTVTNTTTTTVTTTQTVSAPPLTQTLTGPTYTLTTVYAVVPYIDGDSLAHAKSAIDASGLKVGKVTTLKGKGPLVVTSSSPKAGSKLNSGTSVALTLKGK
jgi:hypothetical protein